MILYNPYVAGTDKNNISKHKMMKNWMIRKIINYKYFIHTQSQILFAVHIHTHTYANIICYNYKY
jgi:hypothetical protein